MVRSRSTRIVLFTLPAVLVIALGGAAIYRAADLDLFGFYLAAGRICDRTAAALEKARIFDEKTALEALGESARNGFIYRFDDHLEEASSEAGTAGPPAGSGEGSFSIEFAGEDAVELRPEQGEFAVREGLLEWVHRMGSHLRHEGELAISKDDIGEVEIRLRVKEGNQAELFWSKNSGATARDWHQLGEIAVSTIPDNEFHVYRINATNALKDNLNYGDSIAKIFFVPSDVAGDEVALDYIRFVPRKEKYARTPCGVTHETLDGEMRRVIYVNTPQSLGFRISLPDDDPVLDFGMGILENADPVTFRVTVDSREVFSQRIAKSEEWREGRVDLGEWAGQSVEIGLGAESGKGNIAFWSNPLVHTPPRERFNVIIVLEDALRADYLSGWGLRKGTTPVKDGFAAGGVCFLNAFSQATKTRPSCPSIMTSLYPTATGVWEFTETLAESYLTLAEILRSQGFATAAFIQTTMPDPPPASTRGSAISSTRAFWAGKPRGCTAMNFTGGWPSTAIGTFSFIFI